MNAESNWKMRPRSIIIVSFLAIGVGVGGFVSHLSKYDPASWFETIAICSISLIAVLAGIYMFLGRSWARWLFLVWMAFHVFVSLFNGPSQVLAHALMLAGFAYLLFRPSTSAYFSKRGDRANTDAESQ
jgi:hypothetical protein